MNNNRDNFKSGKKPFSKDGGFKNNRSGDFKRNDRGDRNYGDNKSNNSNKFNNSNSSNKPNRFGSKPNYSSNSSNFSKNNDGRYNNNYKNSDRPQRSFDKPYGDRPKRDFDKPQGSFDRPKRDFNKPYGDRPKRDFDKPYGDRPKRDFDKPYGDKPKRDFDKPQGSFDRPKRNFDKPYGDRPKRSFDKPQGGYSDRPKRDFDNSKKFGNNDRGEKFVRKSNDYKEYKPERIVEKDLPVNIVSSVEQEDSGMVYGRNAVIQLLKSGKSIDKLFVQSGQKEGSITMIFAEAVKKSIPIIEVERTKLDSMINNSAHQGVIALASEKEYCSVEDILQIAEERGEKPFILIADKIMDPHNLGAIIRTAECAGVHGIIIPKRNAAGVSPIVVKTSAGASIHMAIAKVANIANTLEELKEKGVWIFSSSSDLSDSENSAEIKDYNDADYDIPLAFVVGNEGEGLSPIIIQKSDFLVNIPMAGKIESLNVSCASAILMYEAARQRKGK